jgi:hypothetical protein
VIGPAFALALGLAGGGCEAELSRLAGHRVEAAPTPGRYVLAEVAGEGRPELGTVDRDGDALWLRTDDGRRLRLAGPLARPRIAGPGYRAWVLGEERDGVLWARRLGVLAPPPGDAAAARGAASGAKPPLRPSAPPPCMVASPGD